MGQHKAFQGPCDLGVPKFNFGPCLLHPEHLSHCPAKAQRLNGSNMEESYKLNICIKHPDYIDSMPYSIGTVDLLVCLT